MRRRRDVIAVLALLVLLAAIGPLVVGVVQIIREPPPEHVGLAVLGIVGDAFDRMLWSLGIAGVLLILLETVFAAIRSFRNRRQRRMMFSGFWRKRPTGWNRRLHARLPVVT